ncbi:hypothetical protein WN48_06073 [Eufriesea mexicana]|nr:hypothetical protein WN48_06073 [Eufriesea mexicana]
MLDFEQQANQAQALASLDEDWHLLEAFVFVNSHMDLNGEIIKFRNANIERFNVKGNVPNPLEAKIFKEWSILSNRGSSKQNKQRRNTLFEDAPTEWFTKDKV